MAQSRILVFKQYNSMSIAVVRLLVRLIHRIIAKRGICYMVVPGGRSPLAIFKMLSKESIPWSALQIFLSDERCLPIGASGRNDSIIDEIFVKPGILPKENFHPIPAELGPDEGARFYESLLHNKPRFDIVLLGAGEDGHTASLFPGAESLMDQRSAVPVYNSPKPPAERVSIGFHRLRDAHHRLLLVSGNEKQGMMKHIYEGYDLPVTRISPTLYFVNTVAT